MTFKTYYRIFVLFLILLVQLQACTNRTDSIKRDTGNIASIYPDYKDVTIPPNIAPLNFLIKNEGNKFSIEAISNKSGYKLMLSSSDGTVKFPLKKWKQLVTGSSGDSIEVKISSSTASGANRILTPFFIHVANDEIDPWLAYRLIYPGYYSWSKIRIMERSLTSFREKPLFDNQVMDKNCANCHSFNNRDANTFMVHIRGSHGGTYISENGKITRTDPKIDAMPGSATYPSWHPSGRYIAFSSNQVRQSFYSKPGRYIEVFDLVSSLILYDRKANEITTIADKDTTQYLQTFPSWSADGTYLYFCKARQYKSPGNPTIDDIRATHYNIVRKSFNAETAEFGEPELVFNADSLGKSASFPRISPDGKKLVFTLADYGTFPIWHPEADLWSLDLVSGKADKMKLNSDKTESYHTWSSNGRWLVFSSKRLDGRSARPFFAYIGPDGIQGKEFVLPQEDPLMYESMLESFNIPEFVIGEIQAGPRDLEAASHQNPLKPKAGKSAFPVTPVKKAGPNKNYDVPGLIHE